MKYFLIIIFFYSTASSIQAQNYSEIDSIVSNYPKKFKTIENFAKKIDKDFNSKINKIRAVYFWVSNNIQYDYKAYRDRENAYKTIKVKSELDYETRLLKMQRKYAEKVLSKNTGVCEGYSQLIKFTLLELGIPCEVIEGYAKTQTYEIGKKRNTSNHAWNAVQINKKWHLIDATWSTGNNEENPGEFNFSDIYFFINPKEMILSHFPSDKKWQQLKNPITKSQFSNFPIYYDSYFKSGLILNKEENGIIKVKYAKTIAIKFDTIDTSKIYNYSFKNFNYSYPLKFTKTKDGYIAKIKFKSNKNSTLSIISENYTALKFKIILSK